MSGHGDVPTPPDVTATGLATGPVSRADVVGTAVLAAVGLAAVVVGSTYGTLVDGAVGPGFLPVVTGALVLVFSLVEIGRMALARRAERGDRHLDAPVADEQGVVPGDASSDGGSTGGRSTGGKAADVPEETDVFGRTAGQRGRAIAVVFGVLLAAILLGPLLGLLLSLSLAVLGLLLVVERKPPLAALLGAAACLGLGYLVFVRLLGAPLPSGALGLV